MHDAPRWAANKAVEVHTVHRASPDNENVHTVHRAPPDNENVHTVHRASPDNENVHAVHRAPPDKENQEGKQERYSRISSKISVEKSGIQNLSRISTEMTTVV
jgi:hypothetical protein